MASLLASVSLLQVGNWLVHSTVLTRERPQLAFFPPRLFIQAFGIASFPICKLQEIISWISQLKILSVRRSFACTDASCGTTPSPGNQGEIKPSAVWESQDHSWLFAVTWSVCVPWLCQGHPGGVNGSSPQDLDSSSVRPSMVRWAWCGQSLFVAAAVHELGVFSP